MNSNEPEVFRCPTCRAAQERSDTCRRCKCDLRLLHAAADAYRQARHNCLAALRAGQPHAALEYARDCLRLDPTPTARQLYAVCALLSDEFSAAFACARLIPKAWNSKSESGPIAGPPLSE